MWQHLVCSDKPLQERGASPLRCQRHKTLRRETTSCCTRMEPRNSLFGGLLTPLNCAGARSGKKIERLACEDNALGLQPHAKAQHTSSRRYRFCNQCCFHVPGVADVIAVQHVVGGSSCRGTGHAVIIAPPARTPSGRLRARIVPNSEHDI